MRNEWAIISESELGETKQIGDSIRAKCPIHNSRDYDLSIAPKGDKLAGFGHCFSANCDATVLVKEWNPQAVEYALRSLSDGLEVREHKRNKSFVVNTPVASKPKEWQVTLLAALKKLHPVAQEKLQHPRALAYLRERGCSDSLDVLASLGVGYIPPVEEWKKEPMSSLINWCDRFIFPLTDDSGRRGFIARSLYLWQPGMDENEHKRLLDEHDKLQVSTGKYPMLRWRKTYITGFFNASALRDSRTIFVCEGAWDAIALRCAGMTNVVASGGTAMNKLIKGIPPTVKRVVIAFDSDIQTSERYKELLGRVGLSCEVLLAPKDDKGKDWSERYRLCGADGLATLLEEKCEDCFSSIESSDREYYYTESGILYCTKCRPIAIIA